MLNLRYGSVAFVFVAAACFAADKDYKMERRRLTGELAHVKTTLEAEGETARSGRRATKKASGTPIPPGGSDRQP
jgi:hypothetical protein